MQKRSTSGILFILMGLVLLIFGCAKIQLATPPGPAPVKDWRQEHSGAYLLNQDRLFYGIGRAAGSSNPTLLRATADTQAQQEMERVLKAYFDRLLDAVGWQGAPDERQQLIYGLSQAALQRSRITEHRFDESNKTLFALCRLPLAALETSLQNAPYLGSALKQEMLGRAQDVHQRWAADLP